MVSAEQNPTAKEDEAGAAVYLARDHLGPGVDSLGPATIEITVPT